MQLTDRQLEWLATDGKREERSGMILVVLVMACTAAVAFLAIGALTRAESSSKERQGYERAGK